MSVQVDMWEEGETREARGKKEIMEEVGEHVREGQEEMRKREMSSLPTHWLGGGGGGERDIYTDLLTH